MQYSPYSATMNPYQTIYNNGGAAAYQPSWGYSDLLGHALDTNAVLPLGYTRQQYNEERALAAESMWKSPLLGLSTFGVGTAMSYVTWGSPLQDLANKVGGVRGAAAFNVGFNNMPNMATIAQANINLTEATNNLRAGVLKFRAGDITKSEVRDLFESRRAARATLSATTNAYATGNSLWGTVGRISGFINQAHEEVGVLTGNIFKGVGSGIGSAFESGAGSIGGLFESQINKITGNRISPWLEKSGKSLFEMSESGWMAKALDSSVEISKLENSAARMMEMAKSATDVKTAEKYIKAAESLGKQAEQFRGGVFGGIKRSLASTAKEIGTILKSGRGISGLLAAGGGTVLKAGLGFAGGIAASIFNPLTAAEIYMIDQAVGYGIDTYKNYQTENEIKRNLMAKGNRILQYGFANGDRGLQGGFSTAQRDGLVNKIRNMAAIDAYKGDAFGLGADSIFGGHQRYSERLRELKSILNVGTDMGFFDMSRSMDDFEKKFEQTVKTVDKLSKLLKRTKGEIMTVMANVQNTEGIYDMSSIGASVRKKDFAARLSGVDLTTAMQEGAAGAQMARQTGFSAALGASIMSENRIMMNRAIRNGDIDREELFRLGGEQGVLANMQQSMLAMLQDESFRQELAMNYELDPRTGEYVFKGTRLNRIANASSAELKKMHDERYMFANGVSYSRRKYANVRGGKYYDISRVMQADLAKGKISQDTMNTILSGLILQRHAMLNPTASPLQREEALAQGLQEMGLDYEVARIVAHNQMGGYNKFKDHDEMVVAADRYRDAYEKSGMSFSMLMNTGFDFTHSSIGRWSAGIGAGIGAVAGGLIGAKYGMRKGGALIGAGVGGYAGRALMAGTAILANSIDPYSDIATSMRNDLKSSFIKQGLNPNFVDTYLLGPSDEEKVASMKQGQFAKKLVYLTLSGVGADSTSVNSGSSTWKTLASGFNAISENSTRAKNYAKVFLAANNAAAGNVRNTLAGVLDITAGMTSAQLQEHGISKEDARLISDISAALKSGNKIDLTDIKPEQIQRIGEMLGVAFSVAGTDKLYENKQKLMNVLQIDKNGTTESAYRNQLLRDSGNLSHLLDAEQKVGFWRAAYDDYSNSNFIWKATMPLSIGYALNRAGYQKWIQGVENRADITYLEKRKDVAWKSIENRAKDRSEWYQKFFGAFTDRWEYWISGDKEALTRIRNMANDLDTNDISLLQSAMSNATNFGGVLNKNLNKYSPYFKDGDVEWNLIQKMARREALNTDERKIISNLITGLQANMGLSSVSKIAGKVLDSKAIKDRENVEAAVRLLTKDGFKNIKEELKDEAAVGQFINKLLNKEKGFTPEQRNAFFGDLSGRGDEDIRNYFKNLNIGAAQGKILENLANFIEHEKNKIVKQSSEEKTMDAEGKNATVLTDQAMKDFKEGSLIIKEVAGRLGFY